MAEKKQSITDKEVSRRSILKWTGALAAAAALGTVAGYEAREALKPPPTSFKPPLSPEIESRRDVILKQLIDRHAGETTTYYLMRSYTVGGRDVEPMKVHLKDGLVTALEPDDTVNANVAIEDENWDNVIKGTLQVRPRAMWAAYRKMIYDPQRLLYPMKRVGSRGDPNGKFVRITWDEALDTIASKIKEVIAKYGPYSIIKAAISPWVNAGVGSWSIYSFPGHQFAALYACGSESYNASTQVTAIFDTKLIVLWAYTPSEAQSIPERYYLSLARERGIPIISINPRYTLTDEIQSDQWIPIRPGTDAAMQLAVANVLIKENLYDKAFVDKFVYGFDKWNDYLMGVTDKVEKTPEWAEPLTGVPAETIREFARLYARTKPCMLITNNGGARATLTENFAWAGILLQAMTGNMGKPGTTVVIRGGTPSGGKSMPIPSIDTQIGRKPAKYTAPILYANMKLNDAVLLREKLDNGEITTAQYHQIIGNPANNPSPNIRIMFGQPHMYNMQTLPDVLKRVDAIKKLDLAITNTTRADNPTTRTADIALPIADDMELDPVFQLIFNAFTYNAKLLKPRGECKSMEWFYVQLATRLGVLNDYFPKYNDYGDTNWDQMWQDMAKTAYETWAAGETIKPLNPPSWADFQREPVFHWQMDSPPYVALDDEINKGKKFQTQSGKIEAYSNYLAQGAEFLKTTKYGGFIDPYPAYRPELQFGGYHDPDAKDRPLLLMSSHHPRYRVHSWGYRNPWLTDELYEHRAVMSVPDAKARGINDGDPVRAYGDAGEIRIRASVSSRMIPGTVAIWYGVWWDPDPYTGIDHAGDPNVLLIDRACAAKTFPCINRIEVERA